MIQSKVSQEPRRYKDTKPDHDEECRAEYHSKCHCGGSYSGIEKTTTFLELSLMEIHEWEARFDIFFVVGKL